MIALLGEDSGSQPCPCAVTGWGGGVRGLSRASFGRALIPFVSMPPPGRKHLSKALHPPPLGVRASTHELWGLRARTPIERACEKEPVDVSLTLPCFSPSLSPSLPLSLKINKIFFKNYNTLF